MRIFTRTKVALGAVGLVFALALQGYSPGQAQTGGTIKQFSTDLGLTSTTATTVTSSQAFPGGGQLAGCFIQVTTATGPQTTTMGACTGITLTVTCASAAFNSPVTADMHGAAIVSGTTHVNSGAYDTGGPCTAASPPTGVVPTSAVTLTGYPAGSRLVFYINNNTQASRDGCFVYYEGTTGTTPQCFANTSTGNNGTFYEVTSAGTAGALFQTKATSGTGASGNLTIGGVFIVPAQAAGTPTATGTPGTPAATATATATSTPAAAAATATSTSTATATATGTPATATATATAAPATATSTPAPGGTPPPPPTFIPTPITPPPGPPTNTPTITPTPAATATSTATVVPPTATAAVPTATPKPKPKATKTPTPAPTSTSAPPATTKPVVVKVKPTIPPTGGGGTYVYSSTGATKLSRAALTSAAPASLPATGGGADGGNPTSPLAPLALLGAAAVLAGRTVVRRMRK